jgi:Uma2 family endonuclease
MAITTEPFTLEAFLDLPEEKPALEYGDGVITRKMPPHGKHSLLQARLTQCFDRVGEPIELDEILPRFELTVDELFGEPKLSR